jgi:two-component system OmpR family response regulator
MRILIVEDNDQYRELLKDSLTVGKHTVFAAADGATALQILDETSVDIVICDVEMPEMKGTELHARLRKDPRYQKLPFLYLTGYSDLRLLVKELGDSFVRVLNKMTPVREIISTVSEMASQSARCVT